jgi:flagellar basal-body rod protein FlgF
MPGPVQTNGMSSAASALQMLERRQAVLANNLANASTRGFKAETAFSRLMGNALATTDTAIDLTPGTLTQTHNPFDLAVSGNGFFVVQTPNGERFVRNGSFELNANRQLVDGKGNPVLADGGPITIPPGQTEIDESGMIKVNGRPLARLRVERVADGADLQHEGGTMFVPDATRVAIAPADRKVMQGFVEESNVNALTAMTDMLSVLHRYQAAQKTLTTIDEARGIAVNDLATPV